MRGAPTRYQPFMKTTVLVLAPFLGFGAVFALASGLILLVLKFVRPTARWTLAAVDDDLLVARAQLATVMARAMSLPADEIATVMALPAAAAVPELLELPAAGPGTADVEVPEPAAEPVEQVAWEPAMVTPDASPRVSLADVWRAVVPHAAVLRVLVRCLAEARDDIDSASQP